MMRIIGFSGQTDALFGVSDLKNIAQKYVDGMWHGRELRCLHPREQRKLEAWRVSRKFILSVMRRSRDGTYREAINGLKKTDFVNLKPLQLRSVEEVLRAGGIVEVVKGKRRGFRPFIVSIQGEEETSFATDTERDRNPDAGVNPHASSARPSGYRGPV